LQHQGDMFATIAAGAREAGIHDEILKGCHEPSAEDHWTGAPRCSSFHRGRGSPA
jgi:hypothetical protein